MPTKQPDELPTDATGYFAMYMRKLDPKPHPDTCRLAAMRDIFYAGFASGVSASTFRMGAALKKESLDLLEQTQQQLRDGRE